MRREISPVFREIFLFAVAFFITFSTVKLCAQQPLKDASVKIVNAFVFDTDTTSLKNELIVVSEFENINAGSDAVSRIFQEMLTTEFVKTKHFRVLERTQLAKALKEMNINASDLFDPKYQKELGKYVGASYIVLGSISELNNTQYINARLVKLETGENITAADSTVGEASSTTLENVSPNNKEAVGSSKGKTSPSESIPPKKVSNEAGTWTNEQRPSLWISGNKDFKIAWREKLDGLYLTFDTGNLNGDGIQRVAAMEVAPYGNAQIAVLKWNQGKFEKKWQSGKFDYDHSNFYSYYLRVIAQEGSYSYIILSTDGSNSQSFWRKWDGTAYISLYTGNEFAILDTISNDTSMLIAQSRSRAFIMKFDQIEFKETWANPVQHREGIIADSGCSYAAADWDGDGEFETAKVQNPRETKGELNHIEIFSNTGSRKAITQNKYGRRLTSWNPGDSQYPFIVVRKNETDGDNSGNRDMTSIGGYVYLIQWSEDSYEEKWKSIKLDDHILDMQVCDPKNEGKDGLVVLSRDARNSYLTKIVAE